MVAALLRVQGVQVRVLAPDPEYPGRIYPRRKERCCTTTETTAITFTTLKPILDALTAQITVANVVAVLAGILAVTVGFGFAWWAGRKVVRKVMSAFKSGRIGI